MNCSTPLDQKTPVVLTIGRPGVVSAVAGLKGFKVEMTKESYPSRRTPAETVSVVGRQGETHGIVTSTTKMFIN